MSTLVSKALAVGQRALMRVAGETVTYVRATGTMLEIQARAAAVAETIGEAEVAVSAEHYLWVVTATDLVDNTVLFEPAAGDRIVVTDERGQEEVHLVGTPGDGESCFEPNDRQKNELRIHTKLWSEA